MATDPAPDPATDPAPDPKAPAATTTPPPMTPHAIAVTLFAAFEAGVAEVSPRDAVAILRLAYEVEHDAALARRDIAMRQIEQWQQGLQLFRNAVVRQHGQAAWLAIAAEVWEAGPETKN